MQEHEQLTEPRKLSKLAVGSVLTPFSYPFFGFFIAAVQLGSTRPPGAVLERLFLSTILLSPLVGIVMSVIAWNRINRSKGALCGKGLAAVGFQANLLMHLGLWILPTLASCGDPLDKWIMPPLALILVAAVVGLAHSVTAFLDVRHSEEDMSGKRSALAGITASGLAIIACFAVFLAFPYVKETHRDSACKVYLKQLGLVLSLYAYENEEKFPPIDDTKNNFIFEGNMVYPEYLTDASILICTRSPDYQEKISRLEGNPACITDDSYIYLGWFVTSDAEVEDFFNAYDRLTPEDYGKDILDPEKGSVLFPALKGELVLRWREQDVKAAEEKLKTMLGSEVDLSEIPIMWERPYTDIKRFNHEPPGGHVLYLDGHVEFIEYGEKFPMTETMARLLEERPREPIPGCEE